MEQRNVPYEMECMKMAMLKHEEIFRQQVYELHRLYRIQKMLMKKTSPGPSAPKTYHPARHMNLPNPSEDFIDRHQDDEAIDLTLGLGNHYYSQKSARKVSPTRLTSDSVMGLSSSSSGSSNRSKRACLGVGNEFEYPELSRRQGLAMEQPPWLLQVFGLNL